MLKKVSKSTSKPQPEENLSLSASQKPTKPGKSSPWDTRTVQAKLERKVLVLDLDETLVYCRSEKFEKGMIRVQLESQDMKSYLNVVLRPGLKEFLERMQQIFILYIFTTGTKDYAEKLVTEVGIKKYFKKMLHRESCTEVKGKKGVTKEILKLGINEKHILLMDDSVSHSERQPNNFLQVKPFTGNLKDQELLNMIPFLTRLASEEDVRPVAQKYASFVEMERQKLMQNSMLPSAKKEMGVSFDSSKGEIRVDESTNIMDEFENFEDNVNENSVIQGFSRSILLTDRSIADSSRDYSLSKSHDTSKSISKSHDSNKSRMSDSSMILSMSKTNSNFLDQSGWQDRK